MCGKNRNNMKRKTNKKTAAYKNRIKVAIDTIYSLTKDAPFSEGFARYRKNALFVKCASVLRDYGIILNDGNKTAPIYSWSGDAPSSAVYSNVYKKLSEHKPKVVCNSVATPHSTQTVLSLVNFTDQQLWDELKTRNYSIVDNRLCKLTYLP